MHYAVIRRFALIAVVAVPAYSFDRPSAPGVPASVPGQLVVKLRAGVSPESASLTALEATHGAVGWDPLPGSVPPGLRRPAARDARAPEGGEAVARALEEGFERTFVLRLRSTADLDAALARIARIRALSTPSETAVFQRRSGSRTITYFASQGSWGQPHARPLRSAPHGAARPPGTPRAARGIMVAVVDSGLDASHPDIDGNVWTNPGRDTEQRDRRRRQRLSPTTSTGGTSSNDDNVPRRRPRPWHPRGGDRGGGGQQRPGIVGIAPEAKILPVAVSTPPRRGPPRP